jgi:hypothetical protein
VLEQLDFFICNAEFWVTVCRNCGADYVGDVTHVFFQLAIMRYILKNITVFRSHKSRALLKRFFIFYCNKKKNAI